MTFYIVEFIGAFNAKFKNVNFEYFNGVRGEMSRNSDGIYIRGHHIPIRKSLWGSFINEFIMCQNAHSSFNKIKFNIDPQGGYMVSSYCGNKSDCFWELIAFLRLPEGEWRKPSLGEQK